MKDDSKSFQATHATSRPLTASARMLGSFRHVGFITAACTGEHSAWRREPYISSPGPFLNLRDSNRLARASSVGIDKRTSGGADK